MLLPDPVTPSRLALQLALRPSHEWHLIEASDPALAALEIAETLEAAEVSYEQRIPANPAAVLRDVRPGSVLVIEGTESWSESDYQELDRLRQALLTAWPVLIWVTTPVACRRLVHHAPNAADFFHATVGRWSDGSMTDEQRLEHLRALRSRWGLSDQGFIAAVERRELGEDPEHHLWLILLGRDDLVWGPMASPGSPGKP